MNATTYKKDGVEFLKLDIDKIIQKGEAFFVAKMEIAQLLKIYTVEPAEYSLAQILNEEQHYSDDKDYRDALIQEKTNDAAKKNFQRHADPSQIASIATYVKEKRHAFFPNAIIATCEISSRAAIPTSLDEYHAFVLESENRVQCYLEEDDKSHPIKYKLHLPLREKALLIIDGQHRVRGLEEAVDGGLLNSPYEVLLSIFIGYDRSVIAEQFYTINFTPRKVNKSVLYHLMGDFKTGRQEQVFLHEVTRVFNEFPNSPFHGKFKMLGKIDRSVSQEMQAQQTISQAFFIQNLEPAFLMKSTKSIRQPIFSHYFKQGEQGRIIIQSFLFQYFTAIKHKLPNEWNDPKSMARKSVGIGAFIDILYLYFTIKHVEKKFSTDWVSQISSEEITSDFNGLEHVDFESYRSQSSASVVTMIKKEILQKVLFFHATNYENFLEKFKSDYALKFKKWFEDTTLKKNTQPKQFSLFGFFKQG